MKIQHAALAGTAIVALAGALLIASPAFGQTGDDPNYPNNYYRTNPTPEERAQTGQLNSQQAQDEGTSASGQTGVEVQQQNDAAQQRYRQQMDQYQAQREQYENEKDRYHARLAHYYYDRRYPSEWWRGHYTSASLDGFYRLPRRDLLGREVAERDGLVVGHIMDVDRYPDGHIARVEVSIDGGRVAWLDSANLRYDAAERILFTDIPADDLYERSQRGFYNPRP
jgi:hypothetical protein